MEPPSEPDNVEEQSKTENTFKKPTILIGKVGRFPRKTVISKNPTHSDNKPPADIKPEEPVEVVEVKNEEPKEKNENIIVTEPTKEAAPPAPLPAGDKNIPVPYVEPPWSTLPISEKDYGLEVLKSGVIIENVNLMSKPYWVFGRLSTCDIAMAHPTISRHHAVIQYRAEPTEDQPTGFYIYDLGSTHGTFLNKSRLKPKVYARMQVGHMLKLGCSTRTFLLTGPEEDTESESELSVTELKRRRIEELRLRELREKEEIDRLEKEREKKEKEEREKGIDWGMGEDADEETDLSVNPFAETNNEQLYLDDPKKALRGFFEREALELQYECTERGLGQFLCTVELPVDDARGRPIVAEALVKGKKKEAVVQCALEACRILDRHGLLRQATHESKKRKAKNWEENDFYDSDEDTFLDRTGTIEKKREKRMKAKQPQQPVTYQTLVVKEKNISDQIKSIEEQLARVSKSNEKSSDDTDADSLDSYMKELNDSKPDKYTIGKLKNELTQLRKEHLDVIKLVNLTRPADLPPLTPETPKQQPSSSITKPPLSKQLPMFGKRLKVKVMLPSREVPATTTSQQSSDEEEDEDIEDKPEKETKDIQKGEEGKKSERSIEISEKYTKESNQDRLEGSECNKSAGTSSSNNTDKQLNKETVKVQGESSMETDQVQSGTDLEQPSTSQNTVEPTADSEPESDDRKNMLDNLEMKMLQCDSKALESLDNKVKAKISKTVVKLRKIAEEEESIVVDEKRLAIQKRKILEQVSRPTEDRDMDKKMKQLTRITTEFYTIGDRKIKMVNKINKLAEDINKIAVEIRTASKIQHDQAINRMKGFVEKAHKQQVEIYNRLEKLEKSTTDQKVIDKLRTLHNWLSEQKSTMLENLEKLKTTKVTENSKLIEEIMKFEEKADCFITTILEEIRRIQEGSELSMASEVQEASGSKRSIDEEDDENETESERRKKKNMRRIMQRQEKAEVEKKKQYEEDSLKEDYNMWVPPENQTGDGRTSLNDKFGY